MRRIFIIPSVAVLLLACSISGKSTATPVPTPTSTPSPSILSEFPLALGATWKYSAEISYQSPITYTQVATWTGVITQKVIDQKTTSDGKLIFTLQENLEPTPPEGVWRRSRTLKYTVWGDGVFEGSLKIYQWPLSDGLSWKDNPDFGYDLRAEYVGDVDTPYGKLKGCYRWQIRTNPDTSLWTFCPGIGFAEYIYQHHGTRQIEHDALMFYAAGQ